MLLQRCLLKSTLNFMCLNRYTRIFHGICFTTRIKWKLCLSLMITYHYFVIGHQEACPQFGVEMSTKKIRCQLKLIHSLEVVILLLREHTQFMVKMHLHVLLSVRDYGAKRSIISCLISHQVQLVMRLTLNFSFHLRTLCKQLRSSMR